MGRTQIMDVRTLVHLQPDGRHCRCRICYKTLIFVSGNVRRHYKSSHPQHIPIPDRLSRIRPVEHTDPAAIMISTKVTNEDASSSRLSSETSESIFIGKSEETDIVDVNLSDESVSATSSVTRVPTTTLSGDDAFFLQYLGNKFGNYSTRTKNTIQFQINRILYKADMGCFEKATLKS